MLSILDKKNRIKPDWNNLPPTRKTCQSCFKEYESTVLWSKRCPECKKRNAPYKKKLINHKEELPF